MSTVNYGMFTGLTDDTKVCNGCKLSLPRSAYTNANGATYPRSKCKACEGALSKERLKLRKENPLPEAGYHCPICQRSEEEAKGRGGKNIGAWCCDHDHVTKQFRGWLCHDCNRGLGNLQDNVDLLQNAIDYLNKAKKEINE